LVSHGASITSRFDSPSGGRAGDSDGWPRDRSGLEIAMHHLFYFILCFFFLFLLPIVSCILSLPSMAPSCAQAAAQV
jgi:hypothetical protein